jgi:endonuclease YncB( thermonuclease family)
MLRQAIPPRRHSRSRQRTGGATALILAVALAAGIGLLARPAGRLIEGSVQVVDGDSLRMGDIDIRLKGLDAPELKQTCSRAGRTYPCGTTARDALLAIVAHGTPRCRVTGRDRYHRSLARCVVDGRDIGARLVEEGVAVAYGDYEREEGRARMRSVGLWAGEFERPNAWRRSHRP